MFPFACDDPFSSSSSSSPHFVFVFVSFFVQFWEKQKRDGVVWGQNTDTDTRAHTETRIKESLTLVINNALSCNPAGKESERKGRKKKEEQKGKSEKEREGQK